MMEWEWERPLAIKCSTSLVLVASIIIQSACPSISFKLSHYVSSWDISRDTHARTHTFVYIYIYLLYLYFLMFRYRTLFLKIPIKLYPIPLWIWCMLLPFSMRLELAMKPRLARLSAAMGRMLQPERRPEIIWPLRSLMREHALGSSI